MALEKPLSGDVQGTIPANWPPASKAVTVGETETSGGDTESIGVVTVQASSDNDGTVYVGGPGVTTSTGYALEAGESSPPLTPSNLNQIGLIASAADQEVRILYGKKN